jgi:tetratricopeptide (TPR) repeat protein
MRLGKSVASILVFVCLVPRGLAADSPKWLRVTTANFVVYSDASEKRARAIAERLEGFHAMLVSLLPGMASAPRGDRLTVVAFRDGNAFKPFKPVQGGKPSRASGLFLGSSDRDLIALDASADEGSYRVVFHEYIHKIVNRTKLVGETDDAPAPLWFDEGFADFYSTATTKGLTAQIGGLIGGHMVGLQEHGFMPLDKLFAVTHDSPDYNDPDKQNTFYAQSWIFVHYMMLGKSASRQKAFVGFVERLGRGEAPPDAFRAAFGTEMRTIESELKSYIRESTVPLLEIKFTSQSPIDAATVEPAPATEVDFYLGTALAIEGRHADAETYFHRAAEDDPASSLPYEGLGFLAIYQNARPKAKIAFAEAIKRDSRSHYAQYFFAETVIEDRSAQDAARAALERAVALSPSFAGSYALLSRIALRSGDAADAEQWARRGLEVAPRDGRIQYALAAVQMHLKKYDEAQATLERLLKTENNESVRAASRGMLKTLETYRASARQEATPAPATAPHVESFADLRPSLRVASAGVRCQLVRITCAKALTIHVRIDGREQTFTNPSADAVVYLSRDPDSGIQVDCDTAIDRDVIVQFEPASPGAATGVLKAIVFMRPAPN